MMLVVFVRVELRKKVCEIIVFMLIFMSRDVVWFLVMVCIVCLVCVRMMRYCNPSMRVIVIIISMSCCRLICALRMSIVEFLRCRL